MLRSADPLDSEQLVSIANGTGVFQPHEIIALSEVLEDYHAANAAEGHVAQVAIQDDQIVGFVYYAPVAMTDNTWELWWIAVEKTSQGRGLGQAMLREVEADLRVRGARLLLIDTSSLPNYLPTRQFYLKSGYTQIAQITDFYRDGDDKVLFWKKL